VALAKYLKKHRQLYVLHICKTYLASGIKSGSK